MYSSGPLALTYAALCLWVMAGSALGVVCGAGTSPLLSVPVAGGICAASYMGVYVLRLPLMELFHDLDIKERFTVFLFHVAVFISPRIFVKDPPWILSFVALNVPLTLTCLRKNEWSRVLLNNNLIVFIALLAYRLPAPLAWGALGFVAVMWPVTLVVGHFASVLETAEQDAWGLKAQMALVTARELGMTLLCATPLVVATILGSPAPRVARFRPPSLPTPRPLEPVEPMSPAAQWWELARATAWLLVFLALAYLLIRYWRRRSEAPAPEPLAGELDDSVTGRSVAAPPVATRSPAPKPDTNRGRILGLYEDFCEAMRRLEFGRRRHQTAREYGDALAPLSPTPRLTRDTVHTFENARYGVAEIPEAEIARFEEDLKELRMAGAREFARRREAESQTE